MPGSATEGSQRPALVLPSDVAAEPAHRVDEIVGVSAERLEFQAAPLLDARVPRAASDRAFCPQVGGRCIRVPRCHPFGQVRREGVDVSEHTVRVPELENARAGVAGQLLDPAAAVGFPAVPGDSFPGLFATVRCASGDRRRPSPITSSTMVCVATQRGPKLPGPGTAAAPDRASPAVLYRSPIILDA